MRRRKMLARGLATLAVCLIAISAEAASIAPLTGPQDVSQMNATINGVIRQINAIVSPLTGGVGSAGTGINTISLSPAPTGGLATITLQPGADANAGIGISPNGAGNIVLFAQTNTGILQFGNQTNWYPAKGLARCPGVPDGATGGLAEFGPAGTVQGFIPVGDWLGRVHYAGVC